MKSTFTLSALLLCLSLCTFGQLATYGPVAENLQTSMYNTFGVPNENYWWCAHGVDALNDGYLRTRSDTYKTRMKNLLLGTRAFNGNTYINYFYDDMEWMGIATLHAYQSTGDADYYNVASLLWTDIQNGFTNGAVDWNKGCAGCKNTCSNTPAVILGARIYRYTGNAADLQRARDIFAFVKTRLVDPTTGAVWDNINLNTGAIQKDWVFSYNVGTYIGAAWELYKATNDVTYLNDAIKTAEYAYNSRRPNGLFFADETGGGDGGLFKGIFIRYLSELAREGVLSDAVRAKYKAAIQYNAEVLRTQGINTSNNLVSPNWSVPPSNGTDYATQLSGVMLEEAAANLDQAFFYKDINYGGYASPLPLGVYTTANMVAKGIQNNDITSYAIPAGYQVTLFRNDNFQGESITLTGISNWIGGSWNDSASSLIYSQIGVATFYKDCNYTGAFVTLPAGSYTLSQLQARGIQNDDISSLKVNAGYRVTLYLNDNFGGRTVVKTADDGCLVDDNFNDSTSSVVIAAAAPVVAVTNTVKTVDNNLVLYPNPVKDVVALKTGFDISKDVIRIVDLSGRTVLTAYGTTGRVDVSRLPAGVYALVLTHGGQQYVRKFVK